MKDLYDWLEEVDSDGSKRRCPDCMSVDVKFGLHSRQYRGFDVSVCCNNCNKCDTALNEDLETMMRKWHDD